MYDFLLNIVFDAITINLTIKVKFLEAKIFLFFIDLKNLATICISYVNYNCYMCIYGYDTFEIWVIIEGWQH